MHFPLRQSAGLQNPIIVSAGWDKAVKVWSLTNCKLRNNLVGHQVRPTFCSLALLCSLVLLPPCAIMVCAAQPACDTVAACLSLHATCTCTLCSPATPSPCYQPPSSLPARLHLPPYSPFNSPLPPGLRQHRDRLPRRLPVRLRRQGEARLLVGLGWSQMFIMICS